MSRLIPHPHYQELHSTAESLRSQVAALLAELHDLQQVVKPNLLALYQSQLGPWELKLLSAQCEVARLKRKIALAQASLNREEAIDWAAIEEKLEREFLTWKARIDEAAAKVKAAEEHFKHTLSAEESAELKKLYYALVKALHPDLHSRQTEAQQQLWLQVQAAYQAGNLAMLRALAASMAAGAPDAHSPTVLEELKEEIAGLEKHVAALEAQVVQTKAAPPFNMQEQLLSEVWIETRRAEIDTQCASLQNLALQLEAHVKVLDATPYNGTITGLN